MSKAAALRIPLRPHLKTPKSVPIARRLQAAGAKGFNVLTLNEAEYFHSHGLDDLFYCVPTSPKAALRAAKLATKGCYITVMTDTLDGAEAMIAALENSEAGTPLQVVIEIDVDGYRSGCDLAAQHCQALAEVVTRLNAVGLSCEMVSLGSTPAILHAQSLPGVTEARCGIYIFQDLLQSGIGACDQSDIALSVLTTVTACHPRHNRLVIDAGALALSKDRSTMGRPFDAAYGWVCHAETGERIGDLRVEVVSQELGLLTSASGTALDFDEFDVGTRLRILPNHADMTAAAYETYHTIMDGELSDDWSRTNRWD